VENGDVLVWHYADDYTLETDFEGQAAKYPNGWLKAPDVDPPSNGAPPISGGSTASSASAKPVPSPDEESDWTNPYTDVSSGDWFYDAVKYTTQNNILQGVGDNRFEPGTKGTRAMLVTMLYRYEKEPAVQVKTSFSDVAAEQWYTNAIAWAAQNGIVEGYGGGLFGPNDLLTREQTATILYRYAVIHKRNVDKTSSLAVYTDTDKISSWALPAMRWANAEAILLGRSGTTLAPGEAATRAEIAALFMRYIEA
jgi:hypothetical protein